MGAAKRSHTGWVCYDCNAGGHAPDQFAAEAMYVQHKATHRPAPAPHPAPGASAGRCGYCGQSPAPKIIEIGTVYGYTRQEASKPVWCDAGQRPACPDVASCVSRIRAQRAAVRGPGLWARFRAFMRFRGSQAVK